MWNGGLGMGVRGIGWICSPPVHLPFLDEQGVQESLHEVVQKKGMILLGRVNACQKEKRKCKWLTWRRCGHPHGEHMQGPSGESSDFGTQGRVLVSEFIHTGAAALQSQPTGYHAISTKLPATISITSAWPPPAESIPSRSTKYDLTGPLQEGPWCDGVPSNRVRSARSGLRGTACGVSLGRAGSQVRNMAR